MAFRPMRIRLRSNKFRRKGHVIGDDTFISRYAHIDSSAYIETKGFHKVEIGDNCYITRGCKIMTHSRAKMGGPRGLWTGEVEYDSVKIGNNVFIGWDTIILPGVKIGDNVIVGAKSLVTKDIPSNTVVGGVPAKFIKENEFIK